jgi:hypothetical protein
MDVREKPIAQIARVPGIAESGLRRWFTQADIDEGREGGVSSDDRAEAGEIASGEARTPAGRSGTGCEKPGCSGRWGLIRDCFDESVAQRIFAPLQCELLEAQLGPTREAARTRSSPYRGLRAPHRRHSARGRLSHADYEPRDATGRQTRPRPQDDLTRPTLIVRNPGATSFGRPRG